MPDTAGLQASEIWQIEQKRPTDWLATPGLAAAYLSRGRWKPSPHLDLISAEVARVIDEPQFLIVTIPPRHGKSELISVWTPVWFLKRWPWKRVLLASYHSGFAAYWGGRVKSAIEENAHILDLAISQGTKAKAEWALRGHGGGMLSTGIGGAITGRGADLLGLAEQDWNAEILVLYSARRADDPLVVSLGQNYRKSSLPDFIRIRFYEVHSFRP